MTLWQRLKFICTGAIPSPAEVKPKKKTGWFSGAWKPKLTDRQILTDGQSTPEQIKEFYKKAIPGDLQIIKPVDAIGKHLATDSADTTTHKFGMDDLDKLTKQAFDGFPVNANTVVGSMNSEWYASQSFIGYQMCAILGQQWLIDKACRVPAQDAVRKGWEITLNDGTDMPDDVLDYIRRRDKHYKIKENCVEMVSQGRMFGIRIGLFLVDTQDPDYYTKPFNIDGVKPGTYRGISQIDPYWISPELDLAASAEPVNKDFYVPTWWRVSGMRIHKSHLVVYIPYPVADVLKPTYQYGGVSLPQKIYERVYNAERCATEATQLLLTKRANVIHTDLTEAMANKDTFEQKLALWAMYWDNYAVKVVGEDEQYTEHDTTLAGLENTILTQYKLVAAIAETPAAKLLQDSPAGSLNSNGDYEQETYRETLESTQSSGMEPLLTRHYQLLAKSDIANKFPNAAMDDKNFEISFNELDALTETERAEVNNKNANTDLTLVQAGGIDAEMSHKRVIQDPNSGYAAPDDEFEPEPLGEEPDDSLLPDNPDANEEVNGAVPDIPVTQE